MDSLHSPQDEERAQYGLLNPRQKGDTLDTQTLYEGGPHSDFVDVRTRRGKLIFRLDPLRLLVEWRDTRGIELIDLRAYMPR